MKVALLIYLGFCAFYVGVIVISNRISQLPNESRLRQWWHRNVTHFDDMEQD